MANKKVKVLPVRRFNIVHLMFFLFFIYMVIIVGKYIAKEDIKVCEVTEGSLTRNHNYTGLILRTETLMYSEEDGYIKCYLNDGDRINKGGTVFAVDKTGESLSAAGGTAENNITDEQYRSLRKYLNHFSTKYEGQNYTDVYTFKDQLITTLYGMEQQEAEQGDQSTLVMQEAGESGVVYFTMDGLESLSVSQITRKNLEKIALSSSRVLSGDMVESKQAICKIISDETWSIFIPITEEDAAYYADQTRAKLLLNDIDTTVTADIEIYTDANGENLAKLTLGDYMSSYAAERLISFQLVKPVTTGLKVPKTSVVSNELFVIPVEYGYTSKETEKLGFVRKTSDQEEKASEIINPTISYSDGKYYYIDESELEAGSIILKVDENGIVQTDAAEFEVKEKKALEGVYNVNKGYAVFEVVEILDQNDSYCIVKGGTTYGLAVYDHIVLNASTVDEDDLLY